MNLRYQRTMGVQNSGAKPKGTMAVNADTQCVAQPIMADVVRGETKDFQSYALHRKAGGMRTEWQEAQGTALQRSKHLRGDWGKVPGVKKIIPLRFGVVSIAYGCPLLCSPLVT
jgi:hypothetical protein